MSSETQSQTRKRKDKKRKTDHEDDKFEFDLKDSHDSKDHDSSDEGHDDHHHGPPGGVLSTVVFVCLLGGLVVLTTMIYVELKGSTEVGPSISESRYASFLGDFVDEHANDDHDDHDDHGHGDDHDGHGHGDDAHEDTEHAHSEHDDAGHGDDHGEEEEVGFFESFTSFESTETAESHTDEEADVTPIEESPADETSGSDTLAESEDILVNDFSESQPTEEESLIPEPEEEDSDNSPQEATDEDSIDVIDVADSLPLEAEQSDEQIVQQLEDSVQSEEENADQNTEPEASEPIDNEVESVPEEETAEAEPSELPKSEEDYTNEYGIEINEEILILPTDEQGESVFVVEEEIKSTPVEVEATFENEDANDDSVASEDHDNIELAGSQADDWVSYEQADITNQDDFDIHKELDAADKEVEKSAENSKRLFEEILQRYPQSPRATFGKAKALDRLSEQHKSNALLEESIYTYRDVLSLPSVPDKLFRMAGSRCADRMRFRGFIAKSTRIYQKLMERFPENASFHNQLAVSYILLGDNTAAKSILLEVLKKFPTDGFAKVHYGFLLKTADNDYKEGIRYLREGIDTEEEGTMDGRFYFHLGDALMREGYPDQAMQVYEDGVRKKLFLSVYQRSLYNIDSLTGRPWWTVEQTTYEANLKRIEAQWETISNEGLALLDENQEGFVPEAEGLRDKGVWKQFELFVRGKKVPESCAKAPKTCELIESIPEAAGCKRGQVKFSIMHPGTHVWAHTGPTNCRLRAHLGLVVPEGVRIRVANETRSWIQGEFIIFDDSFEHEVWHEGKDFRLVLIVDFWHPDLTAYERQTLTAI